MGEEEKEKPNSRGHNITGVDLGAGIQGLRILTPLAFLDFIQWLFSVKCVNEGGLGTRTQFWS